MSNAIPVADRADRAPMDIDLPVPPRLRDTVTTATALSALTAAWAGAVWLSQHVEADQQLRTVALFAHLAGLVLGFGAVLAIDWTALLWLTGRRRFAEVLSQASTGHVIIWTGLAMLTISGALLAPDLSSVPTRVKLALVLVVAVNGIAAHAIQQRITSSPGKVRPRVLLAGGLVGAISQLGWWSATVIGFANHQSH